MYRLFNLLYDLAVELALPLGGVALCVISNTSKNALPLFVLEVIEPKLVLKQVNILRLDDTRDLTVTNSAFKV